MNERGDTGRFGRVRGLSVAGIEPCGGWYVDGDCTLEFYFGGADGSGD